MIRFWLGILLCQVMLAGSIGVVERYHGKSFIVRGAQRIVVSKGAKVELGDTVRTGLQAWVRIRMNDGTVISAAQRSNFVMKDFVYHKPRDSKATFGFIKGLFKVISGGIGKIARDRFKVTVPNGTIGIRGTEFYVNIKGERTRIFCTRGAIVASNGLGEAMVSSGEQTMLEKGKEPAKPKHFSSKKLRTLQRALSPSRKHSTANMRKTLIEKNKGGILAPGASPGDSQQGKYIRIEPEETREDDLSLNDTARNQQHDFPGTPIYCPTP